ncbi:MAG: 16S rRNA (cytidine1402-2'-O)-methyltransferase [Candidatus Phytoplasma cynodontis]|uniref:16S rRNA (cytidine(1402)-2'-O)-methyltransferase n=1 Tax='Cynodon dactylon' phytoplasma TaxID=295320 RepID=UPI001265C0AC|nr:16S rRNA (cytidine(1402)-2'-O)-methyltransferase ['Cynodon dactylon' phytoplasma]KAB8121957.1 16S rRNA (cytidine(1402)-2'-O)-methyltransferase ['Cynodon dactylon' phytoplasma]WIA07633.1 MAG: 16S rRNA (cytidine1402-2'-O)-methyltransferase [Candidatus Phytoplasma cynodontis]
MIIVQKTFTIKKPILYLVSTPIGNMSDLSFRALEILKKVDYILAEDTRQSRKIFNYYNFKNKLISLYKYNEKKNLNKILFLLESNKNLALISDAGTPLINDPGFFLVKEIKQKGFYVTSIPGPSAFLTAFTVSSLRLPFIFLGFFPRDKKNQEKLFLNYILFQGTIIFYESALRINKTLVLIKKNFPSSNISLSRELTKKFETIISGDIDSVLKEKLSLKGEYVLLVENFYNKTNLYSNLSLDDHIMFFLKRGFSQKESFSKVAKERKITKREIYRRYKILKKSIKEKF